MNLGTLIKELQMADQNYVAPIGLGKPNSWRGDYSCVAFAPVENISVKDMLENAQMALGETFTGYKGGDYLMHEHSKCYIDDYGEWNGDKIGPVLVAYLTGKAQKNQ